MDVKNTIIEAGFNGHDAEVVTTALQEAGLYLTTQDPEADVTHAAPMEWIERQEEERRAWAVTTATEFLSNTPRHTQGDLVTVATAIEEFVKGPKKEDPDLHDQDALDTWGVVMVEQMTDILNNIEKAFPTIGKFDLDKDEFLEHLQDELTKAGVRFKNGNILD